MAEKGQFKKCPHNFPEPLDCSECHHHLKPKQYGKCPFDELRKFKEEEFDGDCNKV